MQRIPINWDVSRVNWDVSSVNWDVPQLIDISPNKLWCTVINRNVPHLFGMHVTEMRYILMSWDVPPINWAVARLIWEVLILLGMYPN